MGIGLDTPRHSANAGSLIYSFLTADGATDGNLNLDWEDDAPTSSTTVATYVCPADYIAKIHRVIIEIQDTGVIGVGLYGAASGLTNGWGLGVYDTDGTLLIDLCDGHRIKTNGDIAGMCYDTTFNNAGAGNLGYINARWTFAKAGQPIVLKAGQYIGLLLEDDYSDLAQHRFFLQGGLTKVFNKGI